jgi:hypothetical protein
MLVARNRIPQLRGTYVSAFEARAIIALFMLKVVPNLHGDRCANPREAVDHHADQSPVAGTFSEKPSATRFVLQRLFSRVTNGEPNAGAFSADSAASQP